MSKMSAADFAQLKRNFLESVVATVEMKEIQQNSYSIGIRLVVRLLFQYLDFEW